MTAERDPPAQRRVFLESEGDGYFGRNPIPPEEIAARAPDDPVVRAIRAAGLAPSSILEVGASHGWRLAWLQQAYPGARCHGLDPSAQAVASGSAAFPDLELVRGTADVLPYADGAFDLVIYGFCLYLCDREDLFRIAAEGDRVLAEGGTLAIFDFMAEAPRRNPYAHVPGLYSYKMDYRRMFSWNPAYRQIHHDVFTHKEGEAPTDDNQVAVTLLRRNARDAYAAPPPEPGGP